MNGFADHGLSEDAFGEKDNLAGGLRSFDAFRKYCRAIPLFSLGSQASVYERSSISICASKLMPDSSQDKIDLHEKDVFRRLRNHRALRPLCPPLIQRASPMVRWT